MQTYDNHKGGRILIIVSSGIELSSLKFEDKFHYSPVSNQSTRPVNEVFLLLSHVYEFPLYTANLILHHPQTKRQLFFFQKSIYK